MIIAVFRDMWNGRLTGLKFYFFLLLRLFLRQVKGRKFNPFLELERSPDGGLTFVVKGNRRNHGSL